VNNLPFRSKSAQTVQLTPVNIVQSDKTSLQKLAPFILWVGEAYDDYKKAGLLLGYDTVIFNSSMDKRLVLYSSAFVVSHVNLKDTVLEMLNMACEYGIPAIWLHQNRMPSIRQIWCFKSCCVKIPTPNRFWSYLCQKMID